MLDNKNLSATGTNICTRSYGTGYASPSPVPLSAHGQLTCTAFVTGTPSGSKPKPRRRNEEPKLPIVILSRYNATGADSMRPGQHLAFCTPTALFEKLAKLDCLHVMVRGVAHGRSEGKTVRYIGIYSIHDPGKTLSYEEYQQLAPEVGARALIPACTMLTRYAASPRLQIFCERRPTGP